MNSFYFRFFVFKANKLKIKMQRWWISDDKTKPSYNESKSKKSSARKEVGDKKWIFRYVHLKQLLKPLTKIYLIYSVLANVELISYEKIAMTGDSEALGNWDPDNCVILQNIEGKLLFIFKETLKRL